MKLIFRAFVLSFLLTSCSKDVYFYQLVELESENMKAVDNQVIASNNDIKVVFDFWDNRGASDFAITNTTNKTIYIKHDECFLIKNGRIIDYYDNAEYTSSSSFNKEVSAQSSNAYTSNNSNILGSIRSKAASISSSTSSSVTKSDKKVLALPPNTTRVIYGPDLDVYRHWDCNVNPIPSRKESNRENGVSFTKDNTPLNIGVLITYSYEDDFSDKKTFETSAFLNHFSNWSPNEFIISENYKDCEEDRYELYRKVFIDHSPLMYYIKYPRPYGGH
jgi:hypothetical protein